MFKYHCIEYAWSIIVLQYRAVHGLVQLMFELDPTLSRPSCVVDWRTHCWPREWMEEILVGLTKISSDLEEISLNRLRSPQKFNYDAENHMDLGKVRSLSMVEMRLERRSKQRKLGSSSGSSLLVSQNFKPKPKLILSISIINDP